MELDRVIHVLAPFSHKPYLDPRFFEDFPNGRVVGELDSFYVLPNLHTRQLNFRTRLAAGGAQMELALL